MVYVCMQLREIGYDGANSQKFIRAKDTIMNLDNITAWSNSI